MTDCSGRTFKRGASSEVARGCLENWTMASQLSEPDRHVVLIAEVDVSLHGHLLRWSVIAVKSVYSVLVERRPEDGKISVPLSTAKDENVVVVDLTNGRGQTLVERLKGGVEAF